MSEADALGKGGFQATAHSHEVFRGEGRGQPERERSKENSNSCRRRGSSEPGLLSPCIAQIGETDWGLSADGKFPPNREEILPSSFQHPPCAVLSHSVTSDSLQLYGLRPARLLCPGDAPSKNTGVDCHALLQGIFPTQRWNPGILHCRRILYQLSQQKSPASSIKLISRSCFVVLG